jgi:hypothetical protein
MRFRIRILLLIKVMGTFYYGTGLKTLQGSILSFQASIQSVYGPPRIYFEPLTKASEFRLKYGCGSSFSLQRESGSSFGK